MRHILVILVILVTLILLAVASTNLCGRGRTPRFEVVLHHKDGSRGAVLISVDIDPLGILLVSQMDLRLLDPAVREIAVPAVHERSDPVYAVWEKPPLPVHWLSLQTKDLLPLFGVYLLALWWRIRQRRRQQRPGGFPVVKPA